MSMKRNCFYPVKDLCCPYQEGEALYTPMIDRSTGKIDSWGITMHGDSDYKGDVNSIGFKNGMLGTSVVGNSLTWKDGFEPSRFCTREELYEESMLFDCNMLDESSLAMSLGSEPTEKWLIDAIFDQLENNTDEDPCFMPDFSVMERGVDDEGIVCVMKTREEEVSMPKSQLGSYVDSFLGANVLFVSEYLPRCDQFYLANFHVFCNVDEKDGKTFRKSMKIPELKRSDPINDIMFLDGYLASLMDSKTNSFLDNRLERSVDFESTKVVFDKFEDDGLVCPMSFEELDHTIMQGCLREDLEDFKFSHCLYYGSRCYISKEELRLNFYPVDSDLGPYKMVALTTIFRDYVNIPHCPKVVYLIPFTANFRLRLFNTDYVPIISYLDMGEAYSLLSSVFSYERVSYYTLSYKINKTFDGVVSNDNGVIKGSGKSKRKYKKGRGRSDVSFSVRTDSKFNYYKSGSSFKAEGVQDIPNNYGRLVGRFGSNFFQDPKNSTRYVYTEHSLSRGFYVALMTNIDYIGEIVCSLKLFINYSY